MVPQPKFERAEDAEDAPVPPSATGKSVIPEMLPPVILTELDAWVDIVPSPSAVLAALAEVELVPPLATDIGVVMVTVGFTMEFSVDGSRTTPVATVAPSVTVAVIVPITPRPLMFYTDCYPQPSNVGRLVVRQ